MNTIAIINQKGGVAKTTTAQAIGAGLALKGYRVLFVDLDAQGNLSYAMGATRGDYNALDALQGKASAQKAVQTTAQGDIIPSAPGLAGADAILTATGKEYRLAEALTPLQGLYDYCILDTPPALGVLTVNALAACTGVIIPAQADIYSLHGIAQLYDTLQTVKRYCNPALEVMGIVLTRHNGRAILSREVAEKIEQTAAQLDTRLYKSTIRECIALREAQAVKQSIFEYSPRSNATEDYGALVNEIIGEGQHNG